MFASLVALNAIYPLQSTQVTTDLTSERSSGSMFHPLSFIWAKTLFLLRRNSFKQLSESPTRCCFWLTVSKHCTHFEHSFLIEKCSCKMGNTLPSDIFHSSTISRDFNLRSAKTNFWCFFYFPWQLPNLSDLSVQHHLCLYDRV